MTLTFTKATKSQFLAFMEARNKSTANRLGAFIAVRESFADKHIANPESFSTWNLCCYAGFAIVSCLIKIRQVR
jgi:hypothetical protein